MTRKTYQVRSADLAGRTNLMDLVAILVLVEDTIEDAVVKMCSSFDQLFLGWWPGCILVDRLGILDVEIGTDLATELNHHSDIEFLREITLASTEISLMRVV